MTRSRELLLGVTAMVLVLTAGALLLVRPVREATLQARDDQRAAQRESQSLQDQIRALEALKTNEAALREQASKAAAEFPSTPGLPGLVDALQDMADKAGVELASVSPSAPKASGSHPQLAEILTQVTVDGGYFEIQDFLTRLENLVNGTDANGHVPPRSLLVNSVSISASGGTSTAAPATTGSASAAPDQLTAAISLSAFQVTASASGTATGGTVPTSTQVR